MFESKEKNRTFHLSPLLFFLVLSAIFLLAPDVSAAEPIKIGLLGPPSNEAGEDFKSYLWGAEIAAAEVNAREGKQVIQFLQALREGKFNRERELKELKEFLVAERIYFLIGHVGQESILPVARIAQEQKIPFLVFQADFLGAGSSGKEPPNLFWISPAPEAFQRAAVRAAAQFSENRFILLVRNSESGRSWAKYFWETLRSLKPGTIAAGELFLSDGGEDYEIPVRTILSSKAEVCLSHLGGKEWIRFAQTAKKQGYFKKIVHFELESAHQEILTALKKEAPEGVWGINTFPFWFLEGRETQGFVNKYRNKTGRYPGINALSGYGSVYALLEAMKKAASLESDNVLEALGGLTFPTPVGALSIRKTDRRALWPIWCGVSKKTVNYPFPILKELKAFGPDSFLPPSGQTDATPDSPSKETTK
ncbi:MAG: amino acid/amide transporter substrate-binding protein, family [Deltaproteobacteria bacterium]|nr:amino acid/amide transporter substrate-binding protein, family [Deltaproteobacteria bacterium]